MKKISIFLASALMLGFASCDDKSDLGQMQVNPQGPVMEADGLAISYEGTVLAGTELNLNTFTGETLKVIDITKADVPEGTEVKAEMQVATEEDFSNAVTIPVVFPEEESKATSKVGEVSTKRISDYLAASRSNSPEARPVYVRYQIFGVNGGSTALLGAEYMGQKTIDVVSYIPIEAKYYLVGKYLGDNKIDQAVEMGHSPLDVYEDPNFSYTFTVTEEQANAGYTWLVVPESQLTATNFEGCYGVEEAEALEGKLVKGAPAGVIKEEGPKKIEINMEYLSYHVRNAYELLYTPGPANGWSFTDNMCLFTDNFEEYHGFVYIEDQFKFTAQADWSPLNWGGADGVLKANGDNIKVEKSDLYWAKTNMTQLTYELTEITSVSMIGGFNSWNGDAELTTTDAQKKVWKGTLTLDDESEWKFRFNKGWDINLGGENTNLVPNGSNLKSAAGTYEVVLDLGKLPYSCTVTKK